MINSQYAYYLFMKYLPLAISAMSGAYFFYYLMFYSELDTEGAKIFLYCGLFTSSVGWFTVFLAEERLRKLMFASHSLIESINRVLKESADEDRD